MVAIGRSLLIFSDVTFKMAAWFENEDVVGAVLTGKCSNYIWVNNIFIAYYGAAYIRGLRVLFISVKYSPN